MKKKHIFDLLEHISKNQKVYFLRKHYPMKKSILPIAMAFMLLPQMLISQDLMDVNHDIALTYEVDVSNTNYQIVKGNPKLSTLKNNCIFTQYICQHIWDFSAHYDWLSIAYSCIKSQHKGTPLK